MKTQPQVVSTHNIVTNGFPTWLIVASSNFLHSGSISNFRQEFSLEYLDKLDRNISDFYNNFTSSSFFSPSSFPFYSIHPYINRFSYLLYADRMS